MGIEGTWRTKWILAIQEEQEMLRKFGHPIGKFQAIQHMLADMATDIE